MPVRLWLFWLPFLLGSGALGFGVLLAQVPGEDRTFDLVVFSLAAVLLTVALWLGFFQSKAPYGRVTGWTKPVVQVVTGMELVFALYGAVGALTYRGL
jgi:hypothetical protein